MRYKENYNGFMTLLRREIVRIVRIWQQTLFPPVITMSLYFVIFGNLIGPRIGNMQGFSYIQYIAPGLVMMAIINNAYMNVSSSFFGNKFQRNIEELLVSPMPSWLIITGYCFGGIARGLAVGVLVLGVSLFFNELSILHVMTTILVAVLTSILFSVAGFINGIFAKKFDDIAIIPMFVLAPLTYLGGVFYTIDLLPEFWQNVSKFNPIVYMVNGFRYGILGVSDVEITHALLIISIFVVSLYVIAIILFEKGVGVRS